MEIKLLLDAATGEIDTTGAGVAFVLACMFTLLLAVVASEEECDCCGHTNYQHDDAGCGAKEIVGSWGARDCNCKGFRKAKVNRG